ncbi:MAG: flavodoxin domain-containing protein [Ectothiorhodospiraceae bacterium]|jgi:menaquinone-dependent protoporphyrinogen oxidase
MARILIFYASTEGQTRKIAQFIAWRLRQSGHEGEVFDVQSVDAAFSFAGIDGVLVGGSVHYGRHQKTLETFLRRHRDVLQRLPCGFFSVSGAAGDPGKQGKDEAHGFAARLLRRVDWKPVDIALFAGAIRYTRYNPIKRWVMRRIAASRGRGTDTRRDYEYTDWDAVGRFADQFVAMVEEGRAVRA